jgi:hypothetical protein
MASRMLSSDRLPLRKRRVNAACLKAEQGNADGRIMATPPAPRPLQIMQRPPQTHLSIARVICITGDLVVLAMSIVAIILIRSTGTVEFVVGFNVALILVFIAIVEL